MTGCAAASGEEKFDSPEAIARFGDILTMEVPIVEIGPRSVFSSSVAIRSIFSICNALRQGGLLTLPDVPPSVCYPSGRHRQRSRPKPEGQRNNLDPRIGRELRKPTRRLPASRRSGASSPGQVNPGKVLIKAVSKNKPKMLSGLNQKVSGQVRGLRILPSRMVHHRPRGTTSPRVDREGERRNPVVFPVRVGFLQRKSMG